MLVVSAYCFESSAQQPRSSDGQPWPHNWLYKQCGRRNPAARIVEAIPKAARDRTRARSLPGAATPLHRWTAAQRLPKHALLPCHLRRQSLRQPSVSEAPTGPTSSPWMAPSRCIPGSPAAERTPLTPSCCCETLVSGLRPTTRAAARMHCHTGQLRPRWVAVASPVFARCINISALSLTLHSC